MKSLHDYFIHSISLDGTLIRAEDIISNNRATYKVVKVIGDEIMYLNIRTGRVYKDHIIFLYDYGFRKIP